MDAQRQLSSLPLAVVLLSPGQIIDAVNPAAEQFFGQSLRRLKGRVLADLVTFSEPLLADRLAEADANVSARSTDVLVAGQGGRRIDVVAAPLVDQPGWQILTLHDIGGAEAMRDNASRGEEGVLRAPAILAHEIKNPLAGIRGAAQLLGRKLGEGDRALTTLIADEVDRIANLIDQMQTLSRRTAPDLAPCNLHEAIRRARAVIEASGNAPAIAEEFDPSLPLVHGNVDALVQVMLNLIANAVDACRDSASPTIVVRTRFASGLLYHPNADSAPVRLPIELRVSDNGPGIAAELREHVFEPFVTSKKSGQGLGLALVRRLVRDMNGRITHDRDEAAGLTHFRVHLPIAAVREQAA
ncbi:MAG: PAS domain-containing protein [Sphingomonadales bacterium]|nr:PAS domain-containing protein [Sphingomonadales bacterium]